MRLDLLRIERGSLQDGFVQGGSHVGLVNRNHAAPPAARLVSFGLLDPSEVFLDILFIHQLHFPPRPLGIGARIARSAIPTTTVGRRLRLRRGRYPCLADA